MFLPMLEFFSNMCWIFYYLNRVLSSFIGAIFVQYVRINLSQQPRGNYGFLLYNCNIFYDN